ncbi:hypothetical protein [Pseudobacteroides cellulosolvens]|uniref:Uncharacterized protein n=1 Tax=Pseudobacteroides cellulosolvens ATCC 35603 = DSM 2933 TaxID=398512 RepID=A0A0L6JGG8_9FIRM|nr:hypothetical protein [Pseudobacteroides cellulosolvens]KNY24799.1 hypothetical protein Bccel_0056 [Pseudobacteroides cellulosolvens ATCC 35603 = DSM 2933]
MLRLKTTLIRIFAVSLIISLPITGCGSKNNGQTGQQQSAQNGQNNEEVPKQLTDIEESIESIITALKGPSVPKDDEGSKNTANPNEEDKEKNSPTDESGNKNNQEGDKKSGEGSDQGGESKDSESPSPAQNTPSPKEGDTGNKPQSSPGKSPQQDPWTKITPLVNRLHYQWNELRPDASSKGASRELTDNFSNSLNNLTNTIITKNKEGTLMASNKLYSYIPDILYLYKSKTSPELKRVKYYTRDAVLNSLTPNWSVAEADITSLKSSLSTFKNTTDKKLNEDVSKLDYSISELEKVIKDKNQPLIDIKGRVVLTNINALEKASEK